jgi:hypothetical protein
LGLYLILMRPTQPNGQKLSANPEFKSSSIQAGGFIWNVHTIGINGFARIRPYKLDTFRRRDDAAADLHAKEDDLRE